MMRDFAIAVAALVVGTGIVAGLRRFSKHKGTPGDWYKHMAALVRRRSRQRSEKKRDALVQRVLDVSTERGVSVVVEVTAGEPVLITYSNGRTVASYSNFERYKAEFGPRHIGTNAVWRRSNKLPVPVTDWPTEQLGEWLQDQDHLG